MESECLARGVPCIEFAMGSKCAKNTIRTDELTAVNSNINIKPINAKNSL